MKPKSKNNIILLVSSCIFLIYLCIYCALEFWVYKTLPFQADQELVNLQINSRMLAGSILKPDNYFQQLIAPLRGDIPHPDIVILNLDNELVSKEDTWPLARSVHAAIFNKLAEMNPRLLVVDAIIEWPQTPWVTEAIGKRLRTRPTRDMVTLLSELNHDLMLRKSLSQFDYVLSYHLAKQSEYISKEERTKKITNLIRQAGKVNMQISGDGVNLVYPFERINGVRDSILSMQQHASAQGFITLAYTRYNTVGNIPLFHRMQTQSDPPRSLFLVHLAPASAAAYLGVDTYQLNLDDGEVDSFQIGDRTIHTNSSGEIVINFYNRKADTMPAIPVIRAYDLLYGDVDAGIMQNKIVIYGSDTTLMHDYHATSVGQLWGTEIQAYAISNILNGDYFYHPRWAPWLEIPLLVFIFVIITLSATRLKPKCSLLATLVVSVIILVIIGIMFIQQRQILSMFIPLSLALSLYIQATTMRYFIDEWQKRLYKNALGLYLSTELADEVADNPHLLSLDGKEEELTVLFSDIRNFTTISESMEPKALTSFLHSYLSPMTDIVFDTGGTLDKYIGDAVMAFWGAPVHHDDHALRAVEAALCMLETLETLREHWLQEGFPPIHIGIGVNTGMMRVGNMGSDRRLSYTVMGDNVNLCSRLEGLTKHYGVEFIVSQTTWNLVHHRYYGRELDRVRVKGKHQAVPIYEIMGRGSSPDTLLEDLNQWQLAQEYYCRREWDKAGVIYKTWLEKYDDLAARKYLQSIEEFRHNPPPPDWDGISTMTTK
jgi:adenylate cyclase